jgi:hypothetical protein
MIPMIRRWRSQYWFSAAVCLLGSAALALQLPFVELSESMGNHDSKIVGADSVD